MCLERRTDALADVHTRSETGPFGMMDEQDAARSDGSGTPAVREGHARFGGGTRDLVVGRAIWWWDMVGR